MTTHRPHHPRLTSARVPDRRRIIATDCIPYDLTGDLGADHVYVDTAGAWRVFGTDEIVWTGPVLGEPGASGRYPAPGNYDGEGRWEPAVVDVTGVWTTAGARGTFSYPAPIDVDTDPTTSVYPVPADGDGDGEIAILDDPSAPPSRILHLPGVNPDTSVAYMFTDYVHPTTGQLVVNHPAFGRWETFANHAYVDSYVAACIAPATPPPTCP